ncbi:MAG: RuBisCO large subunit C-terminal-like domain-containing protein [Chloroflexota bacterium]
MLPSHVTLDLSGIRFSVDYRILGNAEEAHAKAQGICVEQTIEFPPELVPAGDIEDQIIGQITNLIDHDGDVCTVTISYAVETSGYELTQLLNVIFGNTSIQPGIRVERLELPDELLQAFNGPRFGCDGLRDYLSILERPLLCGAIKPMGLPLTELARCVYDFAIGGIDIIKDDHGLADQSFAPFEERVRLCSDAVAKANAETGQKAIYMPNITAPADQILEKALWAKSAGAGGFLIAPGLSGFDAIRMLANDERLQLPIMMHPAFIGSHTTSPNNGLSHYLLYGQLARLAGADATIFPNFGGRFSFSKEECISIAKGTSVEMGHLKPIFPTPGGGMSVERAPELLEVYGRELILLVGGGLFRNSPDIAQNCREFRTLAEGF